MRLLRNDLLDPLRSLLDRAALPIIIAHDSSDLLSTAISISTTAAHFAEAALARQGAAPRRSEAHMSQGAAEELRLKLQDVADTAKHGPLRIPDRTVFHQVSGLSFEFDGRGWFRFLGCEIISTNREFGSFNLLRTLQEFSGELCLQFGDPSLAVPIRPISDFVPTVQLFFDHRSDGFQLSQKLRFYRRDAGGSLILADPPEAKVEWLEASPVVGQYVESPVDWTVSASEASPQHQLVSITTEDGKLLIMTVMQRDPSDEHIRDEIAKLNCAIARWRRIDVSEIPLDRTNRDHWFDDGNRILVAPRLITPS